MASRRNLMRWSCSDRPGAARACWRPTRTMRLIFADGAPGGAEDRWFAMLGEHVARLLHEAAVPLLQGRDHGEERRLARLGRDLARAHRPLDRPFQSAGLAQCRHLLRPALRARRRRHGGCALARRVRCRQRQSGFRQAPGRGRGRRAARARLVRPLPDRAGPHRPQEGGTVRHRQRRTRARHPLSRRGAGDAGAARWRQGGAASAPKASSICSRTRTASSST